MPLERMKLYSSWRGIRRKATAGYAESLQLTRIETADNGLLADLADFRCFPSGENSLHFAINPRPSLGPANANTRGDALRGRSHASKASMTNPSLRRAEFPQPHGKAKSSQHPQSANTSMSLRITKLANAAEL